jgi:hypothetical protein
VVAAAAGARHVEGQAARAADVVGEAAGEVVGLALVGGVDDDHGLAVGVGEVGGVVDLVAELLDEVLHRGLDLYVCVYVYIIYTYIYI